MQAEPTKISGPLVASAISWVRSAYGNDVFEKALTHLTDADRAQLKKLVLSIGWYEVSLFERFCDACYKEVKNKTGESRDTFDKKGIEEGGGAVLKTIYKFILSMTQPVNTINRIPTLFKRTYTQGEISILKNVPGHCVLQFDVPEDMVSNIVRNNKFGYRHLLQLAGATKIDIQTSEKRSGTSYQCLLEMKYQ